MLPITLLPTSESGTFLNSLTTLGAPVPAGDDASPLGAAFADMLGDNAARVPSTLLPAGQNLPASGNPLPLIPASGEAAVPADPEAIVASLAEQIAAILPEVEGAAGDSLAVSEGMDGPLIDDLADTVVRAAPVLPEVPVSEVPVTDLAGRAPDAAAFDATDVLATPVQEKPLRGDPLAPPPPRTPVIDTAIDPRLRRAEPPARPLVEAGLPGPAIVRDSVELVHPLPIAARTALTGAKDGAPLATLAAGHRGADPALPSTVTGAPQTDAQGPAAPLVDARNTAGQQASALVAPIPASDAGIESPHQPRLVVTEAATPGVARTTAPPAALPAIDVPVQDPAWDRAVSERVMMMAANKLQAADIRLTPAELGPLRVQVTLDDGAARVTFSAQHPLTRDVLEQALPRLREMFAESGLQLGDARVDIDDREAQQHQAQSDGTAAADWNEVPDHADETHAAPSAPLRAQRGLVDTFV